MASRQWYTASAGKREGPFSDERVRELIAAGVVQTDTLVWCEGMTNWAKAGQIPGLIPAYMPPPVPQSQSSASPAVHSGNALATTVTVWPLLGRTLLVGIAQLLVVPLPWAATSFFRYFVAHIELPERRAVSFTGKAGDIWYIFILSAICSDISGLLSRAQSPVAVGAIYLVIPLTTLFSWIIARWFFANIAREGRTTPLQFTGGYWAMLGWMLLLILSFITIIGWAWVSTAMLRWVSRNVQGSSRQLVFNGYGWSYLCRALVFALTCIFLVPIPWTLRWFVRWLISQFALVER